MKILFIGNSFSVDTSEHLVTVAHLLGINKIKLLNLYIGGCSINGHYQNIVEDNANYLGYENNGNGFKEIENMSIKNAILSDMWDYIVIQHGSKDGSRYSDIKSYDKLIDLIKKIKEYCLKDVKIVFNMTWVGESYHQHSEIKFYDGNQEELYNKIASLTKKHIVPLKEIDIVVPTGTSIQNARCIFTKELTRDGYHLSLDVGRFIASLTFIKAITNLDISNIDCPDFLSNEDKMLAIQAVNKTFINPFCISK